MQHLERLSSSDAVTWYALGGEYDGAIERYVVSTEGSRDVCNRPELLGVDFNLALEQAMSDSFATAPFADLLRDHPQDRVCVVNFLRGGLNFEIRRALHTAYGFNRHSSAFMSSQRFRDAQGRWHVNEDMYRKLEIPADAVLVMGDVVATGVTMENGLRVILDHLRSIGAPPRGLVFYTIGCHKAEKVLEAITAEAKALFPTYQRTVLVYLEAKFRLVDSKTELRIGIPGTDLVRRDALLAPELERSMFDAAPYVLERCAIYDAGSRAFDVPQYVEDVVEYWEQVAALAADGFTLGAALRERLPERELRDRDAFVAYKKTLWRGVPDAEIEAIYDARQRLEGRDGLESAEALAAVCRERLNTLRSAGGMGDRA